MAIGPTIRRLMGPRLARQAGRMYRKIFVDLAKVADALAASIPRGAHVLDVGGGDGEPLNYLLALRPDIRVTTLDPAPEVGQWIDARYDNYVTRVPGTSLPAYLARNASLPDVIMISDVLHHIPPPARANFLDSIRVLIHRVPGIRIILKDIEPGSWRALMSYWSDRYITGDRGVSLISSADATRLFEEALGPLRREDTTLFEIDSPNYAIVLCR
jgi:SAM-dependent methyltransferase